MTLTEQWKNGELPDGFYYLKLPDGSTDIASEYKIIRYRLTKDADKVEVLAPVQSYQEYLDREAHCAVYSEENKSLKEKISGLQAQNAELIETNDILSCQNKQLRALLKECKEEFARINCGYDVCSGDFEDIIDRIKSTIGESEE